MFYIHARSSSRIFQGGGGRGWYLGVAESVGHRRGRYYFCSLVSLLYNDIFLSLFYLERQLLVIKMKQLSSVFACISVIIFTIFIIYLGSQKGGDQPPNPLPHIRPCIHHLFETHDGFTRPNTLHSYLPRRSSQTPNHRGQQTQDKLFHELDNTLYCVWVKVNHFAKAPYSLG